MIILKNIGPLDAAYLEHDLFLLSSLLLFCPILLYPCFICF